MSTVKKMSTFNQSNKNIDRYIATEAYNSHHAVRKTTKVNPAETNLKQDELNLILMKNSSMKKGKTTLESFRILTRNTAGL